MLHAVDRGVDNNILTLDSLEETLQKHPNILENRDDFFVYKTLFSEIRVKLHNAIENEQDSGKEKYVHTVCQEIEKIFNSYSPAIAPKELWQEQTKHMKVTDVMYDDLIGQLDKRASIIHHANKHIANNPFTKESFDSFCGYVQELYSSKVQNTVAVVSNNKNILFINDRTGLWHIFWGIYQKLLTVHCEQIIARTKRFITEIQNEIESSHDKIGERYRYHYTFDRMWSIVEGFENTIQQRLPNDNKKRQYYKDLFWKRKKEFFRIKKLYDRICGESVFLAAPDQ